MLDTRTNAEKAIAAERAVYALSTIPLRDDLREGLQLANYILAEVRAAAVARQNLETVGGPTHLCGQPKWQLVLDIMNRLAEAVLAPPVKGG